MFSHPINKNMLKNISMKKFENPWTRLYVAVSPFFIIIKKLKDPCTVDAETHITGDILV